MQSIRSTVSVAGYSQGATSVTERGIRKSLPPERFVDLREGEAKPGDPTGDLAYNAEMRWEAMAGEGYLTPVESFFVRNHAPTPSIDPGFWTLRVEGPGVERPLQLTSSAHWVMLESLDAVRMRRPLPVEKAVEEGTLLAFGMNGAMLTPDHGFPLRAIVSGWAAVASVKWLGRIYVSEKQLSSPWNTDKYVLTGGESGAGSGTRRGAGREERPRIGMASTASGG